MEAEKTVSERSDSTDDRVERARELAEELESHREAKRERIERSRVG